MAANKYTATELGDKIDALEARVGLLETAKVGGANTQPASDALLDSEYGDPKIFKDPPRWTGPSFVGVPMSHTTVEFLTEFASFKAWCLEKSLEKNDEKGVKYARMDVAKSLGWIRRMKDGNVKKSPNAPQFMDDDQPAQD